MNWYETTEFAWIFTALGALVLFGRLGQRQRGPFSLSYILSRFIANRDVVLVFESLIFVAFGTVLVMGLVRPATAPQAFAAGLGWTGLARR